MIIKKFQGKTEEEAVLAAKKELGQNVVIMNVRKAKKKGFFSIFKKPLVEVTAALEEEPEKAAPRPALTRSAITAKPEISSMAAIQEGSRSEKVLEEKLESLHSLIEQQLVRENEEESENFKETEDKNVAFLKLIYNTLIDNEVAEKYANELIDEVEKIKKPNVTIDFVLANIYQKMILKFGQPKVITPSRTNAKAVFFIGPTGVGKTTTIAKIASRLCVNEKKKVALLTTDTYRIAAAEQLRTYANILDVPFRVIYSAEEITAAINDFKAYDFILIDTAGHSHTNESQKNSMGQFIHCIDEA
ncbi:MAG TPA: flagellar biosynthesis protein FlhF, partial [Lachnospiraceae bacterium]|nr:flagellar biosynthesis protein FlhF [Lachnospiraceae bacterium]